MLQLSKSAMKVKMRRLRIFEPCAHLWVAKIGYIPRLTVGISLSVGDALSNEKNSKFIGN